MRPFLFLLTALLLAVPARAEITVVATIKPLHSLLAGIMDGVADPHLLLKDTGSPHDATLKPSQARLLNKADVIFWIGPDLETSLQRSITAADKTAKVFTLLNTKGLHRRPLDGNGAHGHGHDDAHFDPHIWLSINNAQTLVVVMTEALQNLDPDNAQAYFNNAITVSRRLEILSDHMQSKLEPVRDVPFAVRHDGYGYLVDAHGLNQVGYIATSAGRAPGVAHIAQLARQLKSQGVQCMFLETQFDDRLGLRMAADAKLKTARLDPIGVPLGAGQDQYFNMMEALARNISGCLTAEP